MAFKKGKEWQIKELSHDHKPDNVLEKKRIV